MAFQLLRSAQRGWRRIMAFDQLVHVVNDVEFRDGERQSEGPAKVAA